MTQDGDVANRRPTIAIIGSAVAVTAVVLAIGIATRGSDPDGASPTDFAAPSGATATLAPGSACEPAPPTTIDVEVVRTLPHASDAYTQGLVMSDGELFESTGRVGESTIRVLDPDTGEELRRRRLPDDVFGEGLAIGGSGELVQLTWKDGLAFRWAPGELTPMGGFSYEGEGWGLTTLDSGTLIMSDGSDQLTVRDPDDFSMMGEWTVQRVGGDADELNELEWDGESIWANRYLTDELVRIDPTCSAVTGVADLSALRADAEAVAERNGEKIDVANGIAHLPGTDRYLLTGKWWPTMYEVRLVEG